MKNNRYPSYDDTAYLGDKGIRMVDKIVSDEMKWIFRDIRKNDFGIDAQLELVDERKRGTGRLLAAQIKCGNNFFSEENTEGFVFRGDKKHLLYWLEHSLPVILVLCNPETGICYWQEVGSASTIALDVGWKIVVPKVNVLCENSKRQLTQIAGRPQNRDIVEVLLYRFLHEKYIREIEICSLFELPRDYNKFAYLAKIKGKMVMIDFHYDFTGKITVEDAAEIIRWKDYNDRVCGPNPLHIYLVSKSKQALTLSIELKNYLESVNGVVYFRLLYSHLLHLDRTHFVIDELDKNDAPITFWPND